MKRIKRYTAETGTRRNKVVILGLILVVMASALGAWAVWQQNAPKPLTSNTTVKEETSGEAQLQSAEGRYLFSGTIVMARAVEREAKGNYDQPFSKFDSFNPEKYDGWLADFECPAIDRVISYQEQVQNLTFNCNPYWFPSLKKYFTMFNLANNHTGDLGAENFIKTQDNLVEAGFQIVGSPDPSDSKNACEVMALPVHAKKSDGSETKGTLPVAFCAFHYFFRTPLPGEMDIVNEYAKVMPVFGLMHAGVEYRPNADDTQKQVARALIDQGTEFVIGNSPHWVQESEVYKGKPIFYSTGNFIFDQLEYEEQRGLSIEVNLKSGGEDLDKWLALGEQCKARYDNCLQLAKEQELKKPEIKLTYEPIGNSGGAYKLTELANPTLQASIEERLRWSATKQALGQ